MKRRIMKFLSIAAVLGSMTVSRGQEGQAGMPGAYLHMGVGARALGMGRAFTAVANDVTAIYWNPAGLAAQDPYQLYFMHSILYLDTSMDFLAASAPTQSLGSFGLAVLALSSGDFEQRTALNEVVGNFSTRDLAFLLSWSKQLSGNFSVGLNYKLVNQKILDFSGSGHGIDFGVKYRFFDRLDAGVAVTNLLKPRVQIAEKTDSYATQFRVGLATTFLQDQLMVSLEMSKISGWGGTEMHLGGEYRFMNRAALRLGLDDESFTFGAGFSFDRFDIGYSNASKSELGSSHRFALHYVFGGFGVNAHAVPRVFSPTGELNITHVNLSVRSRTDVRKWELEITDSQGRVVRHFSAEGEPPKEIVWDGRDASGALVADGDFRYMFDVTTADSKQLHSTGDLVTIDTQGPKGLITTGDEE